MVLVDAVVRSPHHFSGEILGAQHAYSTGTGTKGGSTEELTGIDTDIYGRRLCFAQKPRGHQRETY